MKFIFIALTICGVLFFQNCGKKTYSDKNTEPSLEGVDNDGDGVQDLSEDDVDEKLDYAEASCKYAAEKWFTGVTLAENSSITGVKNGIYLVDHLAAIEDGFGNVVIYSQAANAKVNEISNFKGNVIVCGLDVGSINSGSLGNVYVVGGNVGNIDDFKGNVVIRRGSLDGEVTGSKMNLLVLSGSGEYTGKIYNQ